MNPIRKLRFQAGLTQQEFAKRVGTSQPAIAAYESGAKSPTLRVMRRFATALDLDLVASFVPAMTPEEARSLAYHRAVAKSLVNQPNKVRSRARRNLRRLMSLHPHATRTFERWAKWLRLPEDELARNIVSLDMEAREMRHASPFSGILTAGERTRILRRVRKEQAE